MQKIINKLLWRNRLAGYYFMPLMKIKFIRNGILKYLSGLKYEYRLDCFYHIRKYIKDYSGKIKPGINYISFNQIEIKVPYTDKGFGGAFAMILHEPEVKQTYLDLINHAGIRVCYDVGANDGFHSTLLASQGLTVYSFEPNNNCATTYFKLFKANNFETNWIQKGVSDKKGKLYLNFNKGETYLGFLNTEKVGEFENEEVEVITLDEFSKNHEPAELMKVDTEGFEYKVFIGAKQLIEQNQPFILFEQLESSSENWSDICAFFDKLKYKLITLPIKDSGHSLSEQTAPKGNVLAYHISKEGIIDEIIRSRKGS